MEGIHFFSSYLLLALEVRSCNNKSELSHLYDVPEAKVSSDSLLRNTHQSVNGFSVVDLQSRYS
jgi:hypothetical protein